MLPATREGTFEPSLLSPITILETHSGILTACLNFRAQSCRRPGFRQFQAGGCTVVPAARMMIGLLKTHSCYVENFNSNNKKPVSTE